MGLSGGEIAGIVIGVTLVCILFALYFFAYRRDMFHQANTDLYQTFNAAESTRHRSAVSSGEDAYISRLTQEAAEPDSTGFSFGFDESQARRDYRRADHSLM